VNWDEFELHLRLGTVEGIMNTLFPYETLGIANVVPILDVMRGSPRGAACVIFRGNSEKEPPLDVFFRLSDGSLKNAYCNFRGPAWQCFAEADAEVTFTELANSFAHKDVLGYWAIGLSLQKINGDYERLYPESASHLAISVPSHFQGLYIDSEILSLHYGTQHAHKAD